VGAIGDTDDERVDNRGYCNAPLGFQRHWQDYPRKGPPEQLIVDSMDHLGVDVDVFTGAGTITRPQQSGAPVGFATQP
jgi:hypothetical protein